MCRSLNFIKNSSDITYEELIHIELRLLVVCCFIKSCWSDITYEELIPDTSNFLHQRSRSDITYEELIPSTCDLSHIENICRTLPMRNWYLCDCQTLFCDICRTLPMRNWYYTCSASSWSLKTMIPSDITYEELILYMSPGTTLCPRNVGHYLWGIDT